MNQNSDKIRDQIEYYFGDINLNKNGYLKQLVRDGHEWVAIDVVKQFKRLKRMINDAIDIAEAVRNSELIEVSDDCMKIRRRCDKPLPPRDELISDLKKRSVAVIGFPADVSVDEAQSFLKKFGRVSSVVMCREKENHNFHGKVLATFDEEKDARKFLDNPVQFVYRGKELRRIMQLDFEEEMKAFLESEEQNMKKCGGSVSNLGVCVQC